MENLYQLNHQVKKYSISTKFTLNIKTEKNIYYQGNQGMEVVLLNHEKYQEKQGNK